MEEQKEAVGLNNNPDIQKAAADIQEFLSSLEQQKRMNDAVDAEIEAGSSYDDEVIDVDDSGNILDDDTSKEDIQTDSSVVDHEVEDTIAEDSSDVSEEELDELF